MGVLALSVLVLTVSIINIKSLENMDEVTKLAGLQGVLRYAFIPVMLIPVIGILYAFILLIFPIIWYIVFTPISGGKLFKNVM